MCYMILLINTITQFIEAVKSNRFMLHFILMLNAMRVLIKKILNLKLAIRISKYKNTFSNRYTPNWSKEVSIVSKIKNTLPWTYVMTDMNGESITGRFYEKELQKASQEKFRIEKVLKRKVYKIYVNWKGYDNSFNSWINKKDLE